MLACGTSSTALLRHSSVMSSIINPAQTLSFLPLTSLKNYCVGSTMRKFFALSGTKITAA